MSSPISLAAVGRVLEAYLGNAGITLDLRDKATGKLLTVENEVAGFTDGLLPVFLVAGEAVWQEATGKGLSLHICRDPLALLGYRVERIGAGPFSTVMLAVIEAVEQAGIRDGRLLVNDLNDAVWQAILDRSDRVAAFTGLGPRAPSASEGPSP